MIELFNPKFKPYNSPSNVGLLNILSIYDLQKKTQSINNIFENIKSIRLNKSEQSINK